MADFGTLIKFAAKEDQSSYFASLAHPNDDVAGTEVTGYASVEKLQQKIDGRTVTVEKLLAPLPFENVPIYCAGLNYRSHATEAKLDLPKYPPLWTKPSTSLADPGEDIPINAFCAKSFLDYEGELVFVTSKVAKDLKPEEADSYILGYTIGNDLSCRYFQLPGHSGGQYYFAKAFDKFAPIGPVLVSSETYKATASGRRLVTRVNGEVVQDAELEKDTIFSPAQILSHMSQGTTIPAGTAVMTGTPAGVGWFWDPRRQLQDGDVVEVEIDQLGVLRNVLRFEKA